MNQVAAPQDRAVRARAMAIVRGLITAAALYLVVLGLLTLGWIVVDPVSGRHPDGFRPLRLGFLAVMLFAIVAPAVLVAVGWGRRPHPWAWAAGVVTGALLGTLVSIVVYYPVFRARANWGSFDLAFDLAVVLLLTVMPGIPLAMVAGLLARRRARPRTRP